MIYAGLACRWLLAGAFLLAGAAKARRSQAVFVRMTRVLNLPVGLSRFVARWLAPFELVLGAGLAAGLLTPLLGLVAVVTMVAFGAFLLVGRARDPEFDCGCFGSDRGTVTWVTVVRNVALAAAGLVVYLAGEQPLSVDDVLGGRAAEGVAGSDGVALALTTVALLVGTLAVAEARRAGSARASLRNSAWGEVLS